MWTGLARCKTKPSQFPPNGPTIDVEEPEGSVWVRLAPMEQYPIEPDEMLVRFKIAEDLSANLDQYPGIIEVYEYKEI